MEITREDMKRCELIRISGKVDSITAPEMEETLLGEIESGHKNLVVNLGDLEYISSAGLKALLAAMIRSRRKLPPGDVVISELPAQIRDTFELVGLTHIFKFYSGDVEAVGSF